MARGRRPGRGAGRGRAGPGVTERRTGSGAEPAAGTPGDHRRRAAGPKPPDRHRRRAERLNDPNPLRGSNGVAFGPDGRLYVAQYLLGTISAVDLASGDTDVVTPEDCPVRSPDDLAFGADGSMYVADLVPGIVWRRSPLGAYSVVSDQVMLPNGITCVGDRLFVNEMRMGGRLLELFPDGREPVVLAEGLAMGNAMQAGPDGCLYYPHMMTGEVWRVPPDGGVAERVAREVHEPVAVRFDRGGVLHVLSRGVAGFVTRIDLHGKGSRSVVTSGLVGLDNAAFDAENRMFVSSYAGGGVSELHPDGRTRDVVRRGLVGPYGVTGLGSTVFTADHYRLTAPEGPTRKGAEPRTAADASTVLRTFAHGITSDGTLLHTTSQYGEVATHDPGAGTTRVRATGLARPLGIAAHRDGPLFVVEADRGRILTIDENDVVGVLVGGLPGPVDVALDADGTCYVSDEALGAVLRVDEDGPRVLADGLDRPQGLAVLGAEVFTVETGTRRLVAVSLATGETRTDAEDLPVVPSLDVPGAPRALFSHGMPGIPRSFAGLAADPSGALLLSANEEGTVWRLTPAGPDEEAADAAQ
ncbi:hypothetical protein ACWCWD_16390 [Streptomyces sp. NPDC001493]